MSEELTLFDGLFGPRPGPQQPGDTPNFRDQRLMQKSDFPQPLPVQRRLVKELTLIVGVLLRGEMRRYLQEAEFKGLKFEHIELKGFLYSEFIMKGHDLTSMENDLNAWARRMDDE